MNIKLTVELVPKSAWYKNVRSEIPKKDWDTLRKASYNKAGYKCEVCGGKGSKHPVECHEIWEYDDKTHIQKLKGLTALCPKCHLVKHLGYAQSSGKGEIAIQQLMKVNQMTAEEVNEYIYTVFEVWYQRSQHRWELDLSYLSRKYL